MKAVLFALSGATLLRSERAVYDPLVDSCYPKGESSEYRGLTETTKSGRACMLWTAIPADANAPAITAGNGLGHHAYCRDPDSKGKPYCFRKDAPTETETCNIDVCKIDTRDVQEEAAQVATYVGSHDCKCAAQLFGSTTTTADTSVAGALLQKQKLQKLTVALAKQHKVRMSAIKQMCNCA